MNADQRKKYEQLKKRNAKMVQEAMLKNNVLLQECIEVLKDQEGVLPSNKQEEILTAFNAKLNEALNSSAIIKKMERLNSIDDINPDWIGKRVYIIWDEASLPIIERKLNEVIHNIDNIKAVAFDTWIVSENLCKFIEINHNDEIWKLETC